ncbi:hypothetical protein Lepto7375DRAFT_7399 [Leptolyngbya sp. PCC 7375]|nr:hypothetical protein Lepto7375DRAFT_7399 [Leptolyngbya sp. PCC 7375]
MSNSASAIVPSTQDILSRINGHQRTKTVQQRLIKEYGVDVGQVGRLTPQSVRASSVRAKTLKQQEKLAAKYAQNADSIESSLNQLEAVRSEILSAGSSNLQASDRLLGKAIRTNAKLESTMKREAAKLAGDLRIEQVRSEQGLEQHSATLKGQLDAMSATHDAQMRLIDYEANQNLRQGVSEIKDGYQEAKDNARYNRDFNNYINGHGANTRFRLPSFSAKGMFR